MLTTQEYETTRLHTLPIPAETIHALAVGDLTGDGLLDTVLRFIDRDTVHLLALSHQGETLWRFDTGLPARGGWDQSSNHVPFLCWDMTGDGYASVAVHGAGQAWPHAADETYSIGKPSGEELLILDGRKGTIRARTAWPAWKPRVMMTVAHLDGQDQAPSLVICDETYGHEVITVLDTPDLKVRWRCNQGRPAGHNVDVADIDGDGRQEIIVGGICYRGDGSRHWKAEPFGHTDMTKPAKVIPHLPGLQTWVLVEGQNPGVYLLGHDGQTLWKEPFRHAHFGWIAKHSHTLPGLQLHAAEDGRKADNFSSMREPPFPVFDCTGTLWCSLSNEQRKAFMPIAWCGDGLTDYINRKTGTVLRLQANGQTQHLAHLPDGLLYHRNLIRYAEGADERESIITIDRKRQALTAIRCARAPASGSIPKDSFAYRHDRSQSGSGYYLYCCYHQGWDHCLASQSANP